jgi:diacylglycerol kinase family enzyme
MNSFTRIISVVLLPFVLFTFTGCGLIFDGTKEEVTIQSDPPGATVRVDGQPRGKTPMTVKIQKDTNHTI